MGLSDGKFLNANGVECESPGWSEAQPWVEGDRCIRPNGAGGANDARILYRGALTGHMKFVVYLPRVALRSTLGYRRFAPLGQMNIPDVVRVTENPRPRMVVELDGKNTVDY